MTAPRGRPGTARRLRPLISTAAAALLGFFLSEYLHGRAPVQQQRATVAAAAAAEAAGSSSASCSGRALLPPKSRLELGELLEREGFTTGAELGVQRGEFSKTILDSWPSCRKYIMVDLWKQQENYKEAANVDDTKQQQNYDLAKAAVQQYAEKTQLMRMYTSEAAAKVQDASLDFVYIDARHDYCGCAEDIALWWPKVKPGGIMAGHDFLDAQEIKAYHPNEDWGLCANGTRNEGAVKGAVAEFAEKQGLTVAVVYREYEVNPYATWLVRKPLC